MNSSYLDDIIHDLWKARIELDECLNRSDVLVIRACEYILDTIRKEKLLEENK